MYLFNWPIQRVYPRLSTLPACVQARHIRYEIATVLQVNGAIKWPRCNGARVYGGQRRSKVTGSRFAALLSPHVWLFPTTHQLALGSGRSRCLLDRATMVASCWPNTLPDYQSCIRLHGRQLSCIMWQTRQILHIRQRRRITVCNSAASNFLREVSAFRDVNKCTVLAIFHRTNVHIGMGGMRGTRLFCGQCKWSIAYIDIQIQRFRIQSFCTMLQTSLLQAIAISNCLLIYILHVISYIPGCLRAVREAKWNGGAVVGARRARWPNNTLPGYQSYPCVEP